MLLPIGRVDRCVLNGIAAVDHDPITNVDADVRHAGGVIRPDEKDKITGAGAARPGADVIKALRPQPPEAPAALIVDIADEAGAVKGRVGIGAAPK